MAREFTKPTRDLRDLSLEELQALRARWYEEAASSGTVGGRSVLHEIAMVARALGDRINERYGPKYRWQRAEVDLYVDDYGGYMTARHNGVLVCSTHTGSRLFVPGPWVDVVLAEWDRVITIGRDEAQLRDERERARLLDELLPAAEVR